MGELADLRLNSYIFHCCAKAAHSLRRLYYVNPANLKMMGNKFLGLFGMSLDNFQLDQSAEGGYSINIKK
jgi:hypothetical protein